MPARTTANGAREIPSQPSLQQKRTKRDAASGFCHHWRERSRRRHRSRHTARNERAATGARNERDRGSDVPATTTTSTKREAASGSCHNGREKRRRRDSSKDTAQAASGPESALRAVTGCTASASAPIQQADNAVQQANFPAAFAGATFPAQRLPARLSKRMEAGRESEVRVNRSAQSSEATSALATNEEDSNVIASIVTHLQNGNPALAYVAFRKAHLSVASGLSVDTYVDIVSSISPRVDENVTVFFMRELAKIVHFHSPEEAFYVFHNSRVQTREFLAEWQQHQQRQTSSSASASAALNGYTRFMKT